MYSKRTSFLLCCLAAAIVSCNNQSNTSADASKESTSDSTKNEISVKEDQVSYDISGTGFKSYVAYDDNKKGPRPVVLVVPEWWGLTDYPRMRAKKLAEMGYLAMAVDMYGDGKLAEN